MNFLQALFKVNKKPKVSVYLSNRRRINLSSQILLLGIIIWVCQGGKAIADNGPFSSCPAPAYLSQGTTNSTIKLYSVDLFSGGLSAISASDIPGGINGIGFNQLDGYIYGMKSGTNNIVTRLDKTGVATDLGSIAGLPPGNYNVGDVDSNGVLYVSAGGGTIYGIDITPTSPNYRKVIKTITNVVSGIQDFAFHPTNGKLYTIRQSDGRIYEISWSSGANVTATNNDRGIPTALSTGSAYGGVFFAIDGSFYGYRNGTNGSNDGRIYRITNVAGTGLPIATLITSSARGVSQNDGARCALAPPIYPPNTVDYGDALDTDDDTGTDNYRTKALDNGPGHEIIAGLRIGTNIDGDSGSLQNTPATDDDNNGSPDDEDGIASFPTLYTNAGTSYSVSVNVTNTTGNNAYLVGYIDFNKDGDFDDANEKSTTVTVSNNPTANQSVVFTTPAGMNAGNTYARFRLSSTQAQAESSVGIATSGEVEDYQIAIAGYDYGDAPSSYGDASHDNPATPTVYLGSIKPDKELSTQLGTDSGAAAAGDDNNGTPDDEDAFTALANVPIVGNYSLNVPVHNTSSNPATLHAWIDFDKDGQFESGEYQNATVANNSTSASLNWTVPIGTLPGSTHVRFRLTSDNTLIDNIGTSNIDERSIGNASNGEVEDYPVSISVPIYDYGDAPDTGTGTGAGNYQTTASDGGAAQVKINTAGLVLSLGSNIDTDDGTLQNAAANADDINGTPNDEDGVASFPALTTTANQTYTVPVTVQNNVPSANAYLVGYIDFNKDGDFLDAGEKSATVTIPTNSTNPRTFNVTFITPAGMTTGNTYARFRLGQVKATAESATGASISTDNGEIEDYQIAIVSPISPLAGQLVINEVFYAQTGTSADENDEFIELFNSSNNTIDISGFKLIDGNLLVSAITYPNALDSTAGSITGNQSPYVFPHGTSLQPGEYAVIWIGDETADHDATGATFQAWLGRMPKLNNIGDDIWLYDANTRIIDYMAYGTGADINIRPDSSLGFWDSTYENNLGGAASGQSISLTPNGMDGNTSACWEKRRSL
ncbi:MAG: lamin tail domain-containing protein [Pleurocapsa sp. CRU_1_2]|nr:lamin tail domain-containing protein [Pleurocapsa sp. CRU_1_2]